MKRYPFMAVLLCCMLLFFAMHAHAARPLYTDEQTNAIAEAKRCDKHYGEHWPIEEQYRLDVLFFEAGLVDFISRGLPTDDEVQQEEAIALAYEAACAKYDITDALPKLSMRLQFNVDDYSREWDIYFWDFATTAFDADELISVRLVAATGECLGVYANADGVG